MRKTAPKLILQGDKAKAIKWIPWATKALGRIKNLTVTGVANKVLRPVTGVAVHVWSVNDIDRIRIVVSQLKKECDVSFTSEVTGLAVDFTSTLIGSANRTFWNFGDGQYSGALNPSHTYENAGDYTVTIKGYALTGFIGGNPGAPFVIASTESRTGSHPGSNAGAYADFVSDSWSASATRRNEYSVAYTASPELWKYWGRRLNATIPFQDFIGSFIPGKAIIYLTGGYLTYWRHGSETAYPILEEVSGSTGLGLNMRESNTVPQDNIAGEINSNISLVETVINPIDSSDSDPYSILPDPKPTYTKEGWQTFQFGNDEIGRLNVRPYTCISTKQATITVA